MKIAVAADGDSVSGHFGRCQKYSFFEVEGKTVKSKSHADCPAHQPGFIPRWLKEQGVNVVIAGGAGVKAQELFTEFGIKYFLGVQGKIEEVVKLLLDGKLAGGESLCDNTGTCDH